MVGSLPLDGGGGLGGDVVAHAVDAAHLLQSSSMEGKCGGAGEKEEERGRVRDLQLPRGRERRERKFTPQGKREEREGGEAKDTRDDAPR